MSRDLPKPINSMTACEFDERADLRGYIAEAIFSAYAFTFDEDMTWWGGHRKAVDIDFRGNDGAHHVDVKGAFKMSVVYEPESGPVECLGFMGVGSRSQQARTDEVTDYALVDTGDVFSKVKISANGTVEIFSGSADIYLVPAEDINSQFRQRLTRNGNRSGLNFYLPVEAAQQYLVFSSGAKRDDMQ